MDGSDRTPVATLHAAEPLAVGKQQALSEDAARHLRVVRAAVGDRVALRDGGGGAAVGTLVKLARAAAVVEVEDVAHIGQLPQVHLLAPIADRELSLIHI